jgi:hypothetical protein
VAHDLTVMVEDGHHHYVSAQGKAEDVRSVLDQWYAEKGSVPCHGTRTVVLVLGPMQPKTTRERNPMDPIRLAVNLPDDMKVPVQVNLPLLDNGGQPLLNLDGSSYEPDIQMSTNNPDVATVEQVPGNAGWIVSGAIGTAEVEVSIPFPDGSTATAVVLVNVVASEPGPISITLGEAVDKNPA